MPSLGIDIGGTSVKACVLDGVQARTSRSSPYADPSRGLLVQAIQEAVGELGMLEKAGAVGLCVPGKQTPVGDAVAVSVNLPCLNGWAFADLLSEALGHTPNACTILSDVQAAGEDYLFSHTTAQSGRTAIIAIGTGVGLGVFDQGVPVSIGTGFGIGHLGLMDMGRLGDTDTVGADGSRNTLESYIGARAVERRFPDVEPTALPQAIAMLTRGEPILEALIHALRIVHAIYTPDQIVLMGGVGGAMRPHGALIDAAVRDGLTSLAKPGWALLFGDDAYHASRGAARSALGLLG